jgi:hypothetical protein
MIERLPPLLAALTAPVVTDKPVGVPVDVAEKFEALALEVAARGFHRYSARAVCHRLRWHAQIERGNRAFVINNNWSRHLSRWFLAKHPELPAFFEVRERGYFPDDEAAG